MEVTDLFDERGCRDYRKCEAARMALEVGDRILARRSFSVGYGWGRSFSKELWQEQIIEKATKTTVTANGVTYMRSRGVERGEGKGSFSLIGENKANTLEEIEEASVEFKARASLAREADTLSREINSASTSEKRIPDLATLNKVKEHMLAIMMIIGPTEK